MKLLTHNMMQSNVKGVKNGYPLGIKATKLSVLELEYNPDFTKAMLGRIDYNVLRMAAAALGYTSLPELPPDDALSNEAFLKCLFHALMNLEIEEGQLICQGSGRVFPIKNGIPDMLLNENEVK